MGITYGDKTFEAFIDATIEHLGLPKPKGGELVYRKLFNRFRSEQKLKLEDCEAMVITIPRAIVRSFDLAVAKAEEEAAARKKAAEEAAAKKKAEEEARAKKKAEQEAVAQKEAEEEAAAQKKAE